MRSSQIKVTCVFLLLKFGDLSTLLVQCIQFPTVSVVLFVYVLNMYIETTYSKASLSELSLCQYFRNRHNTYYVYL